MTRLSIAVLVLSALSSTQAFADCSKETAPGPFVTTCSCTGQRVITTSCQYSEGEVGCETVILGSYCGSSGHYTCYIGYAQSTDCTQVQEGSDGRAY
jgi:hypothetical protein